MNGVDAILFHGDVFEKFDAYWNASPLKYAKNVKTPTLVLHSDMDFRVPIEQEVYDLIFTESERDGLWPVTFGEFEQHRRSLYLLNKRTVRLPMMTAFDQPDTMTSCPMRPVSTHALQALSLFNSNFMREESNRFAARLGRECGNDHAFQLRRAYKLALARLPKPVEIKMGEQFLASGGALADFCLALFNRNEFVYVP